MGAASLGKAFNLPLFQLTNRSDGECVAPSVAAMVAEKMQKNVLRIWAQRTMKYNQSSKFSALTLS